MKRIFILLLAISTDGFAADKYVSPAGSDINPGTIERPFKTIEKCEASLVAGDTCYVRAGTYALPAPPALKGQKAIAQYGSESIDLKLPDGTTLKFAGGVRTWESPQISMTQMLSLGRANAVAPVPQPPAPPPAPPTLVTSYVELYIDGKMVSRTAGASLPLLLNYPLNIPRANRQTRRTIEIKVHQ